MAHIQAAKAPEAPPAPTTLSTAATSITLQINPTLEDNGAPATIYKLYMDSGVLSSGISSTPIHTITDYDGTARTYEVTQATEGITSGEKYRFVTTATNAHGESLPSKEVRPAVGHLPAKPAQLRRSTLLSTRTQLAIEWSVEPDTEIPITGYVLEWDKAEGDGVFFEIWNGRGRPEVLTYSISVQTGAKYSFRHKAINANGDSTFSEVLAAYACVSPSPPGRPTWVTSTVSAITLAWERSTDDGGCPIIDYRLYRDAGDASAAATTEIHAAELQGNSQANGLVVTALPASSQGSEFVFQLKVFTAYTKTVLGDGVPSPASLPVLFAGAPGAPPASPRRGSASSASTVHVDVDAVAAANGAAIRSYEFEIDDGLVGAYTVL